jgi:hypothetical protein
MSIDTHLAHEHISIDRYTKQRVVELGRRLDGRTAIYLDTKFWIHLRNAAFGKGSDSEQELLLELRAAVNNGIAFCPISDSIFLELLKQSDKESRSRTAQIIDELSLGVTLATNQVRVATEVARFFYRFETPDVDLYPLRHLVWTKLAYILGFQHPSNTPFDAKTELAVQKSFLDYMWEKSLSDIVSIIDPESGREDMTLGDIARKLNDGNAENAAAIRSFEQVWSDELAGAADLCADIGADVVAEIAEQKGIAPQPRGSSDWLKMRTICLNAIFLALKQRPALRKQLPTVYVEACLHAAIRWDKKRKLSGNDLYDFHHASAALAHCQAFLTERPLQTLLCHLRPKLGDEFNDPVLYDVPTAAQFVRVLRKQP